MGALGKKIYGRVYLISNPFNGKKYVGQTTGKLHLRWKNGHKSKSIVGAAFRKYGADKFSIRQIGFAFSQGALDEREKYWIKKLDTLVPNGYNLMTGGKSRGEFSAQSKAKMSKSQKLSWLSEQKKLVMSEKTKANWMTDSYRETQTRLIGKGTRNARSKYRDAQKRLWGIKSYRDNIVAKRRLRPAATEEFKAKMRKAMTNWWRIRKRSGDHRIRG